ncbi:MAG: hypothetical protein ACTJIB_10505 [Pseudoalteromonas prydzensis]|uniref:hypothetical protein n=1 Tax=Pseudoalteromonas prydzensis TaxID=182141 RepID=UPI003F9496C8
MNTLKLDTIKSDLNLSNTRIQSAMAELGSWQIKTTQTVDENWNFYSKSWHRSHGPKIEVYGRKITFTRKHGRGQIVKTLDLNSWAGNFIEKAIVELGLEPKKPKFPLSIRLHKAFDAKLIKTIRGHKIYERTLLGQAVDYVIVAPLGTTYHSSNYKDLFKGLFKKIRAAKARIDFGEGLVDWTACRKLGFCKEGIKEFCSTFGFDLKGSYSPSEIESAVRKNINAATPFMPELRVLADAYNHKI